MRATCFLLAATTALCACLDFDVFDTEPTTGSTSSTGGAGGAGGDGGAGTTTATTTTGMGGQGGMGGSGGGGGSPPDLPPCGGLTDDFDGATPDLVWDLGSGASFANDRAVASPPNGSFRYLGDPTLVLQDCSISIDVVTDTTQSWFFGWQNLQDGNNILWFLTTAQNGGRVVINDGGLQGYDVATGVTTTRVRISQSDGSYRVETAALGTEDWSVVWALPEAAAPVWLAEPGYPQFGAQGAGAGTDAEYDDFGLP